MSHTDLLISDNVYNKTHYKSVRIFYGISCGLKPSTEYVNQSIYFVIDFWYWIKFDLGNGPTVLWSYRMKIIKLHLLTIQRQAFYLLLILIENIFNGNI